MNRTRAFVLAAIIFVSDQAMKWFVLGPVGLSFVGDSREILPIFDLTLVHNYGVSLGMLTAEAAWQRWLLVALTAGIAVFVAIWLWRETGRRDALALGAILGGAAGNIVDRIRFGYVVDYADLHFGDFRPFLVFNVADAAITIGVLVLLAGAVFARPPQAETKNA